MVRAASRIIFINKVTSVEDEPVIKLNNEETLLNDVDIFFLRISSVKGEANLSSICFTGVIKAISASAESDNTVYNIDSKETFNYCFSAIFNTDIASAILMLSSLFLFIIVLLISRLFIVFFRFETSPFCVKHS
jgi:hypothetical protein